MVSSWFVKKQAEPAFFITRDALEKPERFIANLLRQSAPSQLTQAPDNLLEG
jgi:hypothetical protein